MLCGPIFDRFVANSPATVMLRGVMERALAPDELDRVFAATAEQQYTRELLFSAVVDLMTGVAARVYPSVHAGYHQQRDALGVNVRSVYDKLARTETGLGEALVRHTAAKLGPVVRALKATRTPPVRGYTTKILDGNHLGKTQRRRKELRDVAAGPLPGQTLVVLEPELMLATDVFCCEDGHAQERSLLARVLDRVRARDLWIADRNFCTTGFVLGVAARGGCVLIRQHATTRRWTRETRRRWVGRVDTGRVYERTIWLEDEAGGTHAVRQITLVLDEPTRDGETEIRLITNLPARVGAKRVATVYRDRWTIEHLFLNLTTILHGELNTLPYPRAALFGFCCALVAANVLAVVKGALGAAHGVGTVDEEVSDYHLATDIRLTYPGLMVAFGPDEWQFLGPMPVDEFARWLQAMAAQADLENYPKKPRGPKKPRARRTRFAKAKHIATARLLATERSNK